jgi:hypothetical protein
MTPQNKNYRRSALRWDDRTWRVLPPSSANVNSVEIPQLTLQPLKIWGRYYLFFFLSSLNPTGIYYMVANNQEGPFSAPKLLFAEPEQHFYSSKLFQGFDHYWYLSSAITSFDQLPISVDETGDLRILHNET